MGLSAFRNAWNVSVLALAYRAVSYNAITLIARTPPTDLLTLERREAFEAKRTWIPEGNERRSETNLEPPVTPTSPRFRTMALWVRRVQNSEPPADSGSGWNRVLISPMLLDHWMDRPYRLVSFHLTQLLTEHAFSKKYLYQIGRASSPECFHCGPPVLSSSEVDSAYHTLVHYKNVRE